MGRDRAHVPRAVEGVYLRPSEAAILDRLCQGEHLRTIAEARGTTYQTVESHLENARARTGAATTIQLCVWYVQGLLMVADDRRRKGSS